MARQTVRIHSFRLLATALGFACAGSGGCAGFWDDVTSRDFKPRDVFVRPDPMTVLRDSTDGDARAKAYRSVAEPGQNGGTQREQDQVVQMVSSAAVSEPQPLVRMAAIEALGRFRDPRAVPAIISAYDAAEKLTPDLATAVRGQALTALGKTENPQAVQFLVQAAQKKPTADMSDRERQQVRDTRLAAVRGLKNFKGSADAAQAVAQIAGAEKDVALRDRAKETYVAVTGQELPAERLNAAPQIQTVGATAPAGQ